MKYVSENVENIKIAYIGGGSKGWAWRLMGDFAVETSISGTINLYDIDHQAAVDNKKIGNLFFSREDVPADWKFEVSASLQEALTGADFVIISILPGTFEEMESDVHTPEKYGIYQSVGDTVGPGGFFRALRTIPMYVEIAEAIKTYSPEAWVINYTNPMSICTRTLYKVYPDIKAFGCCHEVFGTQRLLTRVIEDIEGIKGIARDEIKINVLGINHFTWIDQVSYKGRDLFPLYDQFVDKYYLSGFGDWKENNYFSSAQRVKFDLYKRFGLIAAAGDRHLAEFCPGSWYLKDRETVKYWKFALTPVKWRKEEKKEKGKRSKKLISGAEQIEVKRSGEEGINQIKALLGLGDLITNVNIPNYGQMKNIPEDVVVETNALFTKNSLRPLIAGRLPNNIQRLVIPHILNQETIIEAVLTNNKKLAFSAFINDPLANMSLKNAKILFNEMFENTKDYIADLSQQCY